MKLGQLKKISYIMAGIGLLDSVYLTWIKLFNKEAYCAGIGQCDVVNASKYAEVGGIPIALLGVGAYLLIIGLHLLEERKGFFKENAKLGIVGISFIGVLYSAYLTYVELAILHAVCPFCVVSAIVISVVFIIALRRYFLTD